jgi:hypothetical protein
MQEVRAWLGLDPSSETTPDCVSHPIARFVARIQDADSEWRERMCEVLPMLVGSRGSLALEWRRAFRCVDSAVREVAPLALDMYDLAKMANKLRSCRPIVDVVSANAARDAARDIRNTIHASTDSYIAAVAAVEAAADAAALAGCDRVPPGFAHPLGFAAAGPAATAYVATRGACPDPIAFLRELIAMREAP